MSNTKTVMSQAANTLVKPLEVEDVFSTYLYTGTSSAHTITNGIDLDGEGGLAWFKKRNSATNSDHMLFDTERGVNNRLRSNTTDQAYAVTQQLNSFNSNGFTLGTDSPAAPNVLGDEYASWTFRKAPKFFDVVTWTGDGTTGRAISHNLGCEVGAIFVKTTSGSSNWYVYNRNLTSANYGLKLNGTDAEAFWGTGNVTDTTFSFDHQNGSGNTYVAYLFAHNDGDGGFNGGDIIKCGSYTGNQNVDGPEIDLGFEPQFVLVKLASSAGGNWVMADTMRGFVNNPSINQIYANTSDAEQAVPVSQANPTATGFKVTATGGNWNSNGQTYIYIAIRRGTKVPEDATEVFAIDASPNSSFPVYEAGFPVDLGIKRYDYPSSGNSNFACDRLRGSQRLFTNLTNAESSSTDVAFDSQVGWWTQPENSTSISWMWKRAPGYFDAVAYSGNSTAGHTVSHNLGVVPEMMWVKCRTKDEDWSVYHEGLGSPPEENYIYLNHDRVKNFDGNTIKWWNHTAPTDSVFTLGIESRVNLSTHDYIAYLFASLPGISKVGSFTHSNGSNTTVDCGFTSGARFVLVKQTDLADNWFVFDTERGITVSDSPALFLNNTNGESGASYIEPTNSGFIIKNNFWSAGDYIFYAIA